MAKRASLHVACVEYVTLIQFGITLRFASLQQPVGFSLRSHADWHSDQQPDELDAFASADARAFLLPERIAHDESDGDAHGHAIVRPERQPDRRADKEGLAMLKKSAPPCVALSLRAPAVRLVFNAWQFQHFLRPAR